MQNHPLALPAGRPLPRVRRVRTDGDDAFVRDTEPFRREMLAHCYRMLGSVDDAEDVVQETYLRAWRSYGAFEGRSSVRTWLYRIATNACLTALERSGRRVLPSGLGGPEPDPQAAPELAGPGVRWLQPIPDALVAPDGADPAAVVAAREGLRLALIATLQYLPGTQRAVLILRDVLAFPATEVAGILGLSVTAVKSSLQRARGRLRELSLAADDIAEPASPRARAVLDQYIAAFQDADATALQGCSGTTLRWSRRRSAAGSRAARPACRSCATGYSALPVTGGCCPPARTGSPPRSGTAAPPTAPAMRTAWSCSPSPAPASAASSPSATPPWLPCSASPRPCPPTTPASRFRMP